MDTTSLYIRTALTKVYDIYQVFWFATCKCRFTVYSIMVFRRVRKKCAVKGCSQKFCSAFGSVDLHVISSHTVIRHWIMPVHTSGYWIIWITHIEQRERERVLVVFLLTLCWCNHKFFFLRNLGGFHHWLMLWIKLPSLLAAWYFPQQGVKKRLEVGLYENIPLPNLNIEKWRNIVAILSVGAQQGLVGGKIQAGGFRILLEPGLWNPFQNELVIFNSRLL